MIASLAQNYNVKISDNNVINLGTANGWGKRIGDFYGSIEPYKIKNTGKTTAISSCYYEYESEYYDNIEDITYTVIHRVDSGD